MADPQSARLSQLRNIQAKTGRTIAALHAAITASGRVKVSERRSWAMDSFKLGYGDANTLVLWMGQPLPDLAAPGAAPPAAEGDPLDAIYTGAKAHLRPLHEAVITAFAAFGPFEQAPKKSYISLRRKKQFAMLGPATQALLELGLNAKTLPADARLKALPPGGMCNFTLRFGSLSEVDATLLAWARAAYGAAG